MGNRLTKKELSEELNKSLDASVFNEAARKMYVETIVKGGVLMNLTDFLFYAKSCRVRTCMGSKAEGTSLQLPGSDLDVIIYQDFIEADSKHTCSNNQQTLDSRPYLCMLKDESTPLGYTKLHLYQDGKPAESGNLQLEMYCLIIRYPYIVDKNGNCLLKNTYISATQDTNRLETHGPAETQMSESECPTDFVLSFPCHDLPKDVAFWFKRKRPYGWPSPETCKMFKKMGCFVVGVGHLRSPERDLQWRLSFSYQEQYLMRNLNPTQYKCYIVLKFIQKLFLKPVCGDIISSYHCKTALFYTLEKNKQEIWKPENLSLCVRKCLVQLEEWVDHKNCPNYFIPGENMFETKLTYDENQTKKVKSQLTFVLKAYEVVLNVLCKELVNNHSSCSKEMVVVSNARNLKMALLKLSNSVPVSEIEPSFRTDIDWVICYLKGFIESMDVIRNSLQDEVQVSHFQPFYEKALEKLMKNKNQNDFENNISILCSNKDIIVEMFKQAKHYIQSKLSSLYMAKFLQDENEGLPHHICSQAVDTFSHDMKMASLNFMTKKYDRCSEILVNSLTMTSPLPIFCFCTYEKQNNSDFQKQEYNEKYEKAIKSINTDTISDELFNQIHFCLTFDTLEMNLAPNPLQYEAYRSFGIHRTTVKHERYDSWLEWVVIDPTVYIYFLQYINYDIMGDRGGCCAALKNLDNIVLDGVIRGTVVHPETALNALGHIYVAKRWYRLALHCFRRSWLIRPLQNAAKWHVIFMLCAR